MPGVAPRSEIAWLKRHESRERKFAGVLRGIFREQAEAVAQAILDSGTADPAIVSEVFRINDERDRMLDELREPLAGNVALGFRDVLDATEDDRKQGEPFDFGESLISPSFDIPDRSLQEIRRALAEIEQQPFWLEIQRETSTRMVSIIESGIEQGANNERVARRLRDEIGGFEARKRARKIARTETTGSVNAGHQAAQADLESEGFIVSKRWDTIRDQDVRPEHIDLQGVTVKGSEANFDVAGFFVPFPGHWNLPGHLRINCRCTTVSRVVGP